MVCLRNIFINTLHKGDTDDDDDDDYDDNNNNIIGFTMSVCPSVSLSAWRKSAPTERIFVKINILEFFKKSINKIQVSIKSDKNNGYFNRMYIIVQSNTYRSK